jgi:hypothetical protein
MHTLAAYLLGVSGSCRVRFVSCPLLLCCILILLPYAAATQGPGAAGVVENKLSHGDVIASITTQLFGALYEPLAYQDVTPKQRVHHMKVIYGTLFCIWYANLNGYSEYFKGVDVESHVATLGKWQDSGLVAPEAFDNDPLNFKGFRAVDEIGERMSDAAGRVLYYPELHLWCIRELESDAKKYEDAVRAFEAYRTQVRETSKVTRPYLLKKPIRLIPRPKED